MGSTLTKLCVDYIIVDLCEEEFNKALPEYPPALVVEMAKASVRDRELSKRRREPAGRDRCFYHEHKDGKGRTKCCSKKET